MPFICKDRCRRWAMQHPTRGHSPEVDRGFEDITAILLKGNGGNTLYKFGGRFCTACGVAYRFRDGPLLRCPCCSQMLKINPDRRTPGVKEGGRYRQ